MANTTASLKNVNLLNKAQFDTIENPATDELWAIECNPLGVPSDNYIDLTLGVNLSKYTAPANGYLTLSRVTGNGNQFVCLRNVNNGMRIYSGMVGNNAVRVFMPVKKGQVVEVEYNANGALEFFRFIYAEGEI